MELRGLFSHRTASVKQWHADLKRIRGATALARLLLVSSLLLISFGGIAQGQPVEDAPLRWAADAEGGAPYIFKDPKNPAVNIGFEVDMAAELEKELGRRIEWTQYDFRSLVPGLERGDFDFAMNGLEITADRKQRIRLPQAIRVILDDPQMARTRRFLSQVLV